MENIFNFTARLIYWIICTAVFWVGMNILLAIILQVVFGLNAHECFMDSFLKDNVFYPQLGMCAFAALGPALPESK